MRFERRNFLAKAASATALSAAQPALASSGGSVARATEERRGLQRAARLRPGDTIGLVSPANATFERQPVEIAMETLQALGFKVKAGQHLRARWGQFGGTDEQRAADVNAMFADDSVAGILAMTGGSGCNRIVDRLDYDVIARKPKFIGGYSDLTSLVNAIHHRTGLITFHSPVAASEWNAFSAESFRAIVMEGQTALLRNARDPKADHLVQVQDRTSVIRAGRARGRTVGGNLAVLSSLVGTPYLPNFQGRILFLEDVNEYIYRVDRMLSTLRLSGALAQVAGVVLGRFTHCGPGPDSYGTLTLDEVFDNYFLPLGVPVFRGAQIGHIPQKWTVPVGVAVEMDAQAGTVQLLEPAVE